MRDNILSYTNIAESIKNFKSEDFADPSTLYFKIFFYFSNKVIEKDFTSNLLCDSFDFDETNSGNISSRTGWSGNKDDDYVYKNSAYNYLINNDEKERANLLKKFIMLLSEISSNSPWVFSEINGLGDALNYSGIQSQFKTDDENKTITIKTINDGYDERISTLLDLYKSACFSHLNSKEIIPANLRKFDMGIFVFNKPYAHRRKQHFVPTISQNNNIKDLLNISSCKYIELTDCEIMHNSGNSIFDSLDNKEGTNPENEIIISYNNCFTNRFNEFALDQIGDFIITDVDSSVEYQVYDESVYNQYNEEIFKKYESKGSDVSMGDYTNGNTEVDRSINQNNKLEDDITTRLKKEIEKKKKFIEGVIKKSKGIPNTLVDRVNGRIENLIISKLRSLYFGNAHNFSLKNAEALIESLANGDVGNVASTIKQNQNSRNNTLDNNPEYIGNAYPEVNTDNKINEYKAHQGLNKQQKINRLGNTYKNINI